VMQKRRIADLAAQKEDPTAIATRVTRHVTWGEDYRGRLGSEAAFQAISPADMRAFWTQNFGPKDAILLVGGSVDPKVIIPLLDERLGGWNPAVSARVKPTPKAATNATPVLYLVDKPGAAQSVIRVGKPVADRNSPDYYALSVATETLGTFTGRVNMNLREDKGWTYGATCGVRYGYGPGSWGCSTSIVTEFTGPAVGEIRKELTGILADKPVTAAEVAYRKSSDSLGFPGQFEETGAILSEKADIWRYGLPPDWAERYVPGVQKVDVAATNAALRGNIKLDDLVWVVVGDAALVRPGLEQLGIPIVVLDRDGNPVKGN
jgi:zinc protease